MLTGISIQTVSRRPQMMEAQQYPQFFSISTTQKLPYQYRLVADTTDLPLYLAQLNAQGAAGNRFKAYFYNGTQPFNVYVRDASRPSATYIYRYGRCVSNMTELFAQMNRYAAQGYRLIQTLSGPRFCLVYIKDTSKKSKFVYEMVAGFTATEDLLAKSNELGARGYRTPGYTYVRLPLDGNLVYNEVPLYYRNKTQKDCTFSYTSAPLPNSPDELLALLKKQEAKGFIFTMPFDASTGQVLIFTKIRNCQYKSMNIDGFY